MGLVKHCEGEICKRYRPRRFSEVIGHKAVVKSLIEAIKVGESRPKSYLFYGERGVGKTTIARIMAAGLNCEKGDTPEPCLECNNCKEAFSKNALFITEINMAQLNKKEDADEIVRNMYLKTLTGRNKIYILDEVQQLTSSAQNLLLKNLEEPPSNTYIFLCTTEPKKLIKPIRSRCECYELKMPTMEDKREILRSVFENEKWKISKEDSQKVLKAIENATFREILITAEQVIRGGVEVLNVIDEEDAELIEICRLLMKGDFNNIVAKIKTIENLNAEGLRQLILSYLSKVLMNKGYSMEGAKIVGAMDNFLEPFYDANPLPKLLSCLFKACCEMKSK